MTRDGTNSYERDAENRLVKISYPGIGNNSEFTYGSTGARVKIDETRSGTVTTIKQFVADEQRDENGSVVNQFFLLGGNMSSSPTYFVLDILGSIKEVTNSAGIAVCELAYDPFGGPIQLLGNAIPDFQYAGYYVHEPSGLSLTRARAYSSRLGRFLNRDPIEETGAVNLYEYTNNPISFVDPLGTAFMSPSAFEQATGYDRAAAAIANAGCRGVVDSALQIPSFVPGAYLPESWLSVAGWPTKCFWGKGNNPDPAAKAAKCSQKCPAGSRAVIWCKQGSFADPGAPESPVGNPAVNMRTIGENYNYSVRTASGYQGADAPGRAGGQRAYTGFSQPYGGEHYPHSVCCSTCVPNKGK